MKNKLRRCHAVNTPTAVCTNGHPLVSIGPQKQTKQFHHTVILVMRNFYTAYPAFVQDKAFAYHNVEGQITNEEWKDSMRQWTKSSFEAWKNIITEWKQMQEYEIGMYVVYEELMDPETGVAVVHRLADLLRKRGLEIAPVEQIPCIWYRAVEPEYRRLAEFHKYTPGYTVELKAFMIAEMEKFIHEVQPSDNKLATILKMYLEDIRSNVVVDP